MAENARERAVQENADEDEDEFGDFGGFEAADSAAGAPQSQAAASPWALYSAGSTVGQPDLLCAQNRFPTYLDPSGISGISAEVGSVNLNYPAENGPVEPQADLFDFAENQDLFDPARIAENVLDGTLNAASGAGFHAGHGVANGRLPDIGLGINENRLFGQDEELNRQAAAPLENPQPLEVPQEGAAVPDWVNVGPQDVAVREEHNNVEPPPNVENVVVENQSVAIPASDASRVTDDALQERLNALTDRNCELEEDLLRVQEELALQRSRLQEVQVRHAEELEELRKGGHDALALVVDQYKEQSRTVVVEQQEAAQRQLVETLNEQMKTFREMWHMQEEQLVQHREEVRGELSQRIDQAVEESRQQQQEQFDLFLAKEQASQTEALEKAVEAERTAGEERFQKALQEEQEKMKTSFEELRAEYSQKLEEERKIHEVALKSAREEEQRLAQEQIAQLVREERERGRAAIRTALDASMVDVKAYINEQRQADSRVRRRHLASLDVFLESSRQQIALLLESERSDPTLPPSSAHPQNDGSGES